ncbi:N-methyl-L-tryptophan oxidase [Streptomyces sp. NPDC059070]|uniref:N-methyl-L-tryptophan oxidase n=1 Tax=Streptomyces sp. NPDC059070 TaxID=3346713 RepID=UPI0036C1E43D
MAPTYDVIVLGLGGMGSAAACRLAERGVRVLGLERFGPAHDQGSSHGGSRITRQSYFEDPAYVPLLLRAYELYDQVERDSGREIALLCGGMMVGRPECRTVAGAVRSARRWDLPHEMLDAAEIRRRFPAMTPRDDEVALYEARAGLLRPEAMVSAHLQLAAKAGAELRFHEPALHWEELPGGRGVRVRTGQNTYTAGQLVVCPGAWAPELLADLEVPIEVQRQVTYWFRPRGGIDAHLPERQPVYVWEQTGGVQVYGFPAIDGPDGGVKVAFFREGGAPCTPGDIERTVRPAEAEAMATAMRRIAPDLPDTFLRAVTCMYSTTPDEHFVIARHPAHPGTVSVACGFSGHGFKFTPVVGEILAELALDGTTAHPLGLFDPRRFTAPGAPGAAR